MARQPDAILNRFAGGLMLFRNNSLDPDQAKHFVRPGLGPNGKGYEQTIFTGKELTQTSTITAADDYSFVAIFLHIRDKA